jgi:hypothetical protein
VASNDGHCVWYGVCARKSYYKINNCFYDGPPKVLAVEEAEKLKHFCPHLVAESGDTLTCCDSEQVTEDVFEVPPANFTLRRSKISTEDSNKLRQFSSDVHRASRTFCRTFAPLHAARSNQRSLMSPKRSSIKRQTVSSDC